MKYDVYNADNDPKGDMSMKKLIATALSLILALGSLAACGKTETPPAETTAPAVTDENAATQLFKEAYYDVLVDENGELIEPYTETVAEEDGYTDYEGRMFAELFDWNLDGVPELMVGYSLSDSILSEVDFIDVYTVENGKAKKILTANMYNDYMALDPSQSIGFSYGQDGNLYLCLYNEENKEMEAYGETFYSFKDGNVDETKLYFRNENAYEGPDSFVDFRIKDIDVTEEEFNAKRDELGADEKLSIWVHYYDYGALISYLADETQIYTPGFYSGHETNYRFFRWTREINFGYLTTYNDNANETADGTPTEGDFDLLTRIVGGILLSTPYTVVIRDEDGYIHYDQLTEKHVFYDSSSEDALGYAMFMIYNTGVNLSNHFDMIDDYEFYILYDEELPADPLGQFELTPGEGYCKINADQVDWVLENCLNVTPDREKTDDDFDFDYYGLFDYYYYDGYYYYDAAEGGGGGDSPVLVDYTENEDGSYTVRYMNCDGIDCQCRYGHEVLEANAYLKTVDGQQEWCVSYVKQVDFIEF